LNQANHKHCHHISILCKNIFEKDSEKAEIFSKIEPFLTFLNIRQLQRQGADIQTKIEELEELNQSLRQRDKVKMMLYLNYQINLCRYQQGCRKLREDRLQERAP
jgi:hypothetical protein